jgi:hypothetical protein
MVNIPHDTVGHHSSSSSSSSGNALSRKKGGRQIEDLMNELKNSQDNSSSSGTGPGSGTGSGQGAGSGSFMTPKEEKGGSFDTGDPTTTNLYIGNIAPSVTGKHKHNKQWTVMMIKSESCFIMPSNHTVALHLPFTSFSISFFLDYWTSSIPHIEYAPSPIHVYMYVCVCLFVLSLSVTYLLCLCRGALVRAVRPAWRDKQC